MSVILGHVGLFVRIQYMTHDSVPSDRSELSTLGRRLFHYKIKHSCAAVCCRGPGTDVKGTGRPVGRTRIKIIETKELRKQKSVVSSE